MHATTGVQALQPGRVHIKCPNAFLTHLSHQPS
jgi:hypothetical protein